MSGRACKLLNCSSSLKKRKNQIVFRREKKTTAEKLLFTTENCRRNQIRQVAELSRKFERL